MNTLQERLGVAVESDAARYSGADFAVARGAAIAGRVRRRRTVRAAGYGGGAMLAVGVLAVGGSRMPWEVFGGGELEVGARDCVAASVQTVASSEPAPGEMREAPLTTVSASNVPSETGASVVTFTQVSTDEVLTAYVNGPGVSIDETGDGPPFFTFHEDDGTYSLDFTDGTRVFFTADGETATLVRVEAPAPTVSPSPSADCLTPEPSQNASPSPSVTPSEEAPQALEGSPFDIGFALPSEESGTADLFIGSTRWVSPEDINAELVRGHEDPAEAPQALGTDAIPQVVVTERAGGQLYFAGGVGGPLDPEVLIDRGVGSYDNPGAVFVQGAAFVAVRDGVVVGVLLFTEDPVTAPAAHLDVYANSERDILLTLLNPTGAFVDASGATLTGAYDVYTVAGAGYYDQTGAYTGTSYAWKKLDPPA